MNETDKLEIISGEILMVSNRRHHDKVAKVITLIQLIALFAIASIWSLSADSAEVSSNLLWTAPTTRTDGTPLAATEIAEYRVYYAVDPDVLNHGAPGFIPVVAGVAHTFTIDLAPRTDPYTILFAVTTVDTAGRESVFSNIASKSFTVSSTANPAPPTGLSITIQCLGECTITDARLITGMGFG